MISPEIQSLCRDIEQRMGVALQSPADFEHLIQQIWDKQHSVLSLSTIKRIWGYVQSNGVPRLSTLNTLSQFLDYADWNAYLVALEQRKESESGMFMGEGVRVSELQVGECIEVTWQPNRHCVFRYLGNNHFVVEEAKNAKLQQGNTFDAACFIIGQPMYLDHLLLADGTRTTYVAGKRHGLTSVTTLNNSTPRPHGPLRFWLHISHCFLY